MLRSLARHPFAAGVLCVTALFALCIAPVRFTFMADDFVHLAASYRVAHLYTEWFSRWLVRLPVWTVGMWGIFGSHVLEHTWLPVVAVFAAHAGAVALIGRWLLRELSPALAAVPAWLVAVAVAAAALYPNNYEILYWPTCMTFAFAGLLMAAALYVRAPALAASLLLAVFLTYETFVLPAGALLIAPALVSPERRWRDLVARGLPWGVAAVGLALVRVALAVVEGGGYHHRLSLAPHHLGSQLRLAASQLFTVRFFSGGGSWAATAPLWIVLGGGVILLWRRGIRLAPAVLLALTLLSTGIYWLLAYNAMRAIYASQLMLCGIIIWLVVRATALGLRPALAAAACLALAAGFLVQSARIWSVKTHNAERLASYEAALADKLAACPKACTVEYTSPEEATQADWVLPRDYWDGYLEWLRWKHAPEKTVSFVLAKEGRR